MAATHPDRPTCTEILRALARTRTTPRCLAAADRSTTERTKFLPGGQSFTFALFTLSMAAVRWRLHRMNDQQRAHLLFSWLWFGAATMMMVTSWFSREAQGQSAEHMFRIASAVLITTTYMRRLAIPWTPRLLTILVVGATFCLQRPAVSVLGQPNEGCATRGTRPPRRVAVFVGIRFGHVGHGYDLWGGNIVAVG